MNALPAKWSQALTASDLLPIVAQILDQPTVEILDWQIKKLAGSSAEYTGRGLGIYRLSGTAHYNSYTSPWSVILKVAGPF